MSWLLTENEPLHFILKKIDNMKKPNIIDILCTILILPFSCGKCMGFWLGLIMSHNLYTAILCSLIMYLYGVIIEKIKWLNL